jgi:hypothetical protein
MIRQGPCEIRQYPTSHLQHDTGNMILALLLLSWSRFLLSRKRRIIGQIFSLFSYFFLKILSLLFRFTLAFFPVL